MNLFRLAAILAVSFAFVALAATASADEKAVDKEKIVGTWLVTKSAGGLPPSATLEFTKDGKLKISFKAQAKGQKTAQTFNAEGTYKVEGDKLSIVLGQKGKERKETMTIKTLTDQKLVTVDPKGEEVEFKKK